MAHTKECIEHNIDSEIYDCICDDGIIELKGAPGRCCPDCTAVKLPCQGDCSFWNNNKIFETLKRSQNIALDFLHDTQSSHDDADIREYTITIFNHITSKELK